MFDAPHLSNESSSSRSRVSYHGARHLTPSSFAHSFGVVYNWEYIDQYCKLVNSFVDSRKEQDDRQSTEISSLRHGFVP